MSKYSPFRPLEEELSSALLDAEAQEALAPEECDHLFSFAHAAPREQDRHSLRNRSYWRSTLTKFSRNRLAMCMLAVMALILLFSILQPLLPGQLDPTAINNDPVTGLQVMNRKPGHEFWLGTNSIGRDLWARIWAGTRTSLLIGFAVAVLRNLLGVAVGFLWGYVRALDDVFTGLYNIIDNIPSTIILMLATYILRPGVGTIIFSMCVTGWLGVARFVRNQVVILRDRDFNRASRCLGTPISRIILKNLLPHTLSVIVLQFVLTIPSAIGSEVFLTYIGLGLPAQQPSLGNLINTGRMLVMSPSLRYQFYFPCIVLSLITVCFYMVGSAFADAADPKNHD